MSQYLNSLRADLEQEIARYNLAGVIVGIFHQGVTEYLGCGQIRLGQPSVPDERTIFRIGSVTKTYTAQSIILLVEQGLLELDDPLTKWLPELAPRRFAVEGLTLRAVLEHCSGLPSDGTSEYWADGTSAHWTESRFPSVEQLIGELPLTDLAVAPGTVTKYSNLGFALLGLVISRVSGQSYEDFLSSALLAPLDLQQTTFTDPPSGMMAMGYNYDDAGSGLVRVGPMEQNAFAPAGQLRSTAADQIRWARYQIEHWRARYTQMELADVGPVRLGWFTQIIAERLLISHGGAVPGFQSALLIDPVGEWAAVALSNTLGHPVCDEIVQLAHAQEFGTHTNLAGMSSARELILPETAPEVDHHRYFLWQGTRALLKIEGGLLLFIFPVIAGLPLPVGDLLVETSQPDVFAVSSGRFLGENLHIRRGVDGEPVSITCPGGAVFRRAEDSGGLRTT